MSPKHLQHSRLRYRFAALGATANVISRIASMVVMVLTIRWAAPVLGSERFGIWATFSGMVAMLSFLDLGVGNALINRVAHAAVSENKQELRTSVTGGLGWLVTIGTASAAILMLFAVYTPWREVFKLTSAEAGVDAAQTARVFAALFGVNLITGGLLKVLVGQQRSYQAHLISAGSVVLSAPIVWLAARQHVGAAGLMAAGFGVQSLVSLILVTLILVRKQSFDLRNMGKAMSAERRLLLHTGSLFFVLQIGTMIGWGADGFILASVAGATQVAALAVAQRLFQFVSQPIAVANSSLWAAYADANARGDRAFLGLTFRRAMVLSLTAAAVLVPLLLLIAPIVIPYWTQGVVVVPYGLLMAFAVWTLFEAGGNALSNYLNGIGIVREQVVVVGCFCAVALPLKLIATSRYGAIGLVASTSVAYAVSAVSIYSTLFRRKILAPIVGVQG